MAFSAFFATADAPFAKKQIGNAKKDVDVSGGCPACGLLGSKPPKNIATGKGKKGLFLLVENSIGERDIVRELSLHGFDIEQDCFLLRAVACNPPKNRAPTDKEIAFCRTFVLSEIERCDPSVIICFGSSALKSLVQNRANFAKGFPGISNWQGEMIPDQFLGRYIKPTWKPQYVKSMDHAVYTKKWKQDIKEACHLALDILDDPAKKVVVHDFDSMIEVSLSTSNAVERLSWLYDHLLSQKDPQVSFDYETTGKKPYAEGHKCVCVSIAYADDACMSFMLNEQTWPIVERILRHPKIGKSAFNMKFEHLWTRVRGGNKGFVVQNWHWDSMLGGHICDNRTARNGLKFQAYANLGVIGYDRNISDYLKSRGDDNSFNRCAQAPAKELLLYCGYDSLLERRLSKIQQKRIYADHKLKAAYDLFHAGTLTLADAEFNGISVDLNYAVKQAAHLERRIEHMKKKILDHEEVQKWKRLFGSKFNLGSGHQLGVLLYSELGMEVTKKTDTGKGATSKDVLEDMEHLPFVKDLLQIRKLEKLKGTYLKPYHTLPVDGLLHPSFHLHKVISYRGSCSGPNFQNVPKRDSEGQKIVRSALRPRNDMCWFEVDYSGIEVRIAATYHNDPNMIAYLKDPTTDMHRDTCMDLTFLPQEEVTKYLRNSAKNGFVFAQFYGDWYKACAANIWNKWWGSSDALLADGTTHIKTHLARHGIKNLDQFTKHVQKVEDIFWNERFPVYNEWRKQHFSTYLKRGWFRGHTGFKYTSPMQRNDAINYGTQGAAFHCLLWAMTRINNYFKAGKHDAFLIGQIHDAVDGNIAPHAINEVLPAIKKIMIDDLVDNFDWINVPIDVEFELGTINGSWFTVKEVKQRPQPCSCGIEWGYAKKQPNGVRWSCPICEEFTVF